MQLLINILPSCITLVLYIRYSTLISILILNLSNAKGEDRGKFKQRNSLSYIGAELNTQVLRCCFSVFEMSHTFSFVTFCCKVGSEISLLYVRSREITLEALVAQSVTQLSRFCTFLQVRLITRKAVSQDINITQVSTLQNQHLIYIHDAGNKEREMQSTARTTCCWFT